MRQAASFPGYQPRLEVENILSCPFLSLQLPVAFTPANVHKLHISCFAIPSFLQLGKITSLARILPRFIYSKPRNCFPLHRQIHNPAHDCFGAPNYSEKWEPRFFRPSRMLKFKTSEMQQGLLFQNPNCFRYFRACCRTDGVWIFL